MALRRFAVLICLAVLGCDGGWNDASFVDEGIMCVRQEGATFTVDVHPPDCPSSSCSRNIEVSCTATLAGDRIEVTADFSWEEEGRRFQSCTAHCADVIATCELDALPDGDYTAQLGGDVHPVTLPLDEQKCLF